MTPDTETRYVASKPCLAACYHVDRECDKAVQGRREPRPASEAELAYHDLGPCPECGDGGGYRR